MMVTEDKISFDFEYAETLNKSMEELKGVSRWDLLLISKAKNEDGPLREAAVEGTNKWVWPNMPRESINYIISESGIVKIPDWSQVVPSNCLSLSL